MFHSQMMTGTEKEPDRGQWFLGLAPTKKKNIVDLILSHRQNWEWVCWCNERLVTPRDTLQNETSERRSYFLRRAGWGCGGEWWWWWWERSSPFYQFFLSRRVKRSWKEFVGRIEESCDLDLEVAWGRILTRIPRPPSAQVTFNMYLIERRWWHTFLDFFRIMNSLHQA